MVKIQNSPNQALQIIGNKRSKVPQTGFLNSLSKRISYVAIPAFVLYTLSSLPGVDASTTKDCVQWCMQQKLDPMTKMLCIFGCGAIKTFF